jgi:hypothetical protein
MIRATIPSIFSFERFPPRERCALPCVPDRTSDTAGRPGIVRVSLRGDVDVRWVASTPDA